MDRRDNTMMAGMNAVVVVGTRMMMGAREMALLIQCHKTVCLLDYSH